MLDLAGAFASGRRGGPVTGTWRPGDARHVIASPARARERLGFLAAVRFAAGMAPVARAVRTRRGDVRKAVRRRLEGEIGDNLFEGPFVGRA